MIASLQLIITIILGSEQNINHFIISLYKSLSTDTFLLTNDLVEASLWASTVEVTLHTSGAPLLFSCPIVWQNGRTFSRGKQVSSTECTFVLCFNVPGAERKPRLAFTATAIPGVLCRRWRWRWRVTLLFPWRVCSNKRR